MSLVFTIAEWVFWLSVGLVIYTYAVYPLLLVVLACGRQAWIDLRFAAGRRERRQRYAGSELPTVSLVFAAYNEEAVIVEKMRNCAELDYPAEKLEILVGCDGCSDRTAQLARAHAAANVRVLEFTQRSGKPEVLNRLVAGARGNLVVFSDANTLFAPQALHRLARHFGDLQIGCACGEVRFIAPDGSPRPEGFYWRYEVFLKFLESRLGMLLGANGPIYAIRRELFQPLPRLAIIDDFLVAMAVRRQGYKLVYDPEALAFEAPAEGIRDEFHRRVRIGAGGFHSLRFTALLLTPLAGAVAFSFWSHKVLRWLAPLALLLALLSATLLAAQPFYLACLAAGVVGVALAFVGFRREGRAPLHPAIALPYYFLSMNLALLVGFGRFLTGSQNAAWKRTLRPEPLATKAKAAGGGA